MGIKDAKYIIQMPDGSKWSIPVLLIAKNRAEYYAGEFEDDVQKSLKEDTLPLFEADEYEIRDWASGNMNWDDVKEVAVELNTGKEKIDYQEGWMNGC